jgi:hypothetical protein
MSEARYATVMVICYLLVRKQWRGPIAPPQITKQGSGYDFERHNSVLFKQVTVGLSPGHSDRMGYITQC